MFKKNLESFTLSEQEVNDILSHIHSIEKILNGKLVQLSPDERKELPKAGDRTISFVNKALEHANENPVLVPQYMNLEEFKKDVEASELLRHIGNPLQQLTDSIHDTMLLCGSEAYANALTFYNSVKWGKKNGIQNAQFIFEDLSNQFSKKSKRILNNDQTTTTPQ